jgi:dipeptidyl-peptidase-4
MAIPRKIHYSPDSRFVTYLFSAAGDLVLDLWRIDLTTGKQERWLEPPGGGVTEQSISRDEELRRERTRTLEVGITDYVWAEKTEVLLLPIAGDLYRWRDGALHQIAGGGVIDPTISPDGSRVFFVRDGEVWCVDERDEHVLTTGSSPGVTNGLAEFIAQEELGRSSGYWPSPDGGLLAFSHVDEGHIPIYPIVHQGNPQVEVEEHRYPFAGAANARVKLALIAATGGKPIDLELPTEDGYIARVDWHPDGRLFVQWLRRDWQRLSLLVYQPTSGERVEILVDEAQPWVNLHNDLRFLPATGEFIWSSERTGFRHLYLHAPDGRLLRQLTRGDWPAEAVVALDVNRRDVYFTGWQHTPVEQHLFRVSLDGGEPIQITTEPGTHAVVIAPDFSSFVDVHDSRAHPPSVTVRGMSGDSRHMLHRPAEVDLDLTPPELHELQADGGVRLHAAVYRPRGSGKAPVVVEVYGGPTAQTVTESWAMTVDLRAQMLVEHGFVVLKLDNRGSARRGVAFEAPIARRMGDVEVRDQVAGVRWLESLGIADVSRVGITGWSYGGYMTLMSLLRAPDVFKAGVAGAPVTDWDGYDSGYTEKYMGTPQNNPDGYRDASALTYAASLRGDLLVVHGMIDENVHFRHTARLIQALIDAGRPYETLLYPNERHLPRSERDRADMERRLLEFFITHLGA